MSAAGSAAEPPIVVVGAGLAGLAAAVTIRRRGGRVLVLEASDGVGGRVRTDHTDDGFTLDRGFQALFTAYPAVRDLLDLRALDLRQFDAGALIAGCAPPQVVVDPFAHPLQAWRMLARRPLTVGDARRLLTLKLALAGPRSPLLRRTPERSTAAEIEARSFSPAARDRFLAPLFRTILLDRELGTRAPWSLFLFKMLSEGKVALPAHGMGAVAEQLAGRLPEGALRRQTQVDCLLRDAAGRIRGVQAGGAEIAARQVILAADLWSARALLPELPSFPPLGCTTLYYASVTPLYRERKLVLNPDPAGFLNSCAQLTNIARSYAPPGQHLLSCTTLGVPDLDDDAIDARARAELRRWFGTAADGLRRLAVYRLPRAQFSQPPGWLERRPAARTDIPSLLLAGEYTRSSSINGALSSGVAAARLALAGA